MGLLDHGGGAGVASPIDELLDVPPERLLHFAERPVRDGNHFKASSQALAETPLDQQRSRTQHENLQRHARVRAGVPQQLHVVGPAGDFLDFVQHQQGATFAFASFEPTEVLLLLRGVQNLADQGGLSHLAPPGEDLDEPAGFFNPAPKSVRRGTADHDDLLRSDCKRRMTARLRGGARTSIDQ